MLVAANFASPDPISPSPVLSRRAAGEYGQMISADQMR